MIVGSVDVRRLIMERDVNVQQIKETALLLTGKFVMVKENANVVYAIVTSIHLSKDQHVKIALPVRANVKITDLVFNVISNQRKIPAIRIAQLLKRLTIYTILHLTMTGENVNFVMTILVIFISSIIIKRIILKHKEQKSVHIR